MTLVPALLWPEWFQQFTQTVDYYFFIQPRNLFWNDNMHEPLIVRLYFPFPQIRSLGVAEGPVYGRTGEDVVRSVQNLSSTRREYFAQILESKGDNRMSASNCGAGGATTP
jgi:hypothetical protein